MDEEIRSGGTEQNQQKLVPAVERASLILDIVAASRRFMTVSDLARETSLPKSTVHNLCMTLVQLDLLIRRPDQTYILGPHVLRWANAFDRQTDVAAEFAAMWDQAEIDADVVLSLSVPEKNEVVFLAARQAGAGSRFSIRPGMRAQAPFIAAGKAILACRQDYEIKRMFAEDFPAPATEHSARSLGDLFEMVRGARSQGYAVDREESQPGVANISAPVLNSLNQPIAAIMVSLPSEHLDQPAETRLSAMTVDLSDRLSRRMGADPGPRN